MMFRKGKKYIYTYKSIFFTKHLVFFLLKAHLVMHVTSELNFNLRGKYAQSRTCFLQSPRTLGKKLLAKLFKLTWFILFQRR